MAMVSATENLKPGFLSAPQRAAVPSVHWWENIDIDLPSQFNNASKVLSQMSTASDLGTIAESMRSNEAVSRFFEVARNTSLGISNEG